MSKKNLNQRPATSNQQLIKLTAMAHGGEALGRDESGRVVFVPYGIPGETVRVEIVEQNKGFARARLVEVVTPSPARVTPRCPHFGPASPSTPQPPSPSPILEWEREKGVPEGRTNTRESADEMDSTLTNPSIRAKGRWVRGCGGCQWQHIAYATQLELKTQIMRDQFARVGKMADAPVAPTIPDPRGWNYRNHVEFALNQEGALC